MGLDQEEGEEAVESNLVHIKKWFGDVQALDFVEPVPYSCSSPVPSGVTADAISGISSLQSVIQVRPTAPQEASVANSGDIDVNSSTFRTDRASKRTAKIDHAGSEFDSDFDDEFNLDEFAASAGAARDIPNDDELTERELDIVNRVSRAMDDAVDGLVGVSTDFFWQNNFDTFRSVPEIFSGPTPGLVSDYDTPYEVFTDIWSQDFMELIVQETNRYAHQTIKEQIEARKLKESSRLRRWTDTDVDEMFRFFAIYIFMGIDSRTSQHEYWKTTGYLQMPMFKDIMPYNRYILLSKFLHFTDNSDVSQNLPQRAGITHSAKLRKIAPVLAHLNLKFSILYNSHPDIAIDESLTLFKGRLSWIQMIRTKAARFGIKSYELCESKSGYLRKFEIYTGKTSERSDVAVVTGVAPNIDLAGKSTQVVLGLLEDLCGRGHLVTMDNFYNCPALARHLKSVGFL